eukprot:7991372-Lingulodinium_polyedra.AAC.1
MLVGASGCAAREAGQRPCRASRARGPAPAPTGAPLPRLGGRAAAAPQVPEPSATHDPSRKR